MNEANVQSLKNYQEKGYAETAICESDERPKLIYLIDSQERQIDELFGIKTDIEKRLHSLHNTNTPRPDPANDKPMDRPSDVVGRIEQHNNVLSVLMEEFYQIRNKINGLI